MPASRWDDLMHNCCEGPLGASVGHGHGPWWDEKIDTWKAGKKTSKKLKDPMESLKHHRVWISTTGSIDFVATSWGSISSVFIT